MKQNIKKILKVTAILSITALTCVMCIFTAFAQTYKEIGGCLYFEFENDSYNAKANIQRYMYDIDPDWNIYLSEDGKEYALERDHVVVYEDDDDFELSYTALKIPDKITSKSKTRDVSAILGSVACHEFDLNPKNKYMSLIDNVIFSKDGKTLMSYAQFDDRIVYEIPDNTQTIKDSSFHACNNLTEVIIPNNVKEIEVFSFVSMESLERINIPPLLEELNKTFPNCESLKEVYIPKDSKLKRIKGNAFFCTNINELTLPSFEIDIDKEAFAGCKKDVKLKSYITTNAKAVYSKDAETYKLNWDGVSSAAKYEVYQKNKYGSYKLIKETAGTSIKLNGIKSGKKYTFAVKPIAEIKANGDGGVYIHYDLPEYYTIEGTMSDDVTVIAYSNSTLEM